MNRENTTLKIRQAVDSDLLTIAQLAQHLWSRHTVQELRNEMQQYLLTGAVFLAFDGEKAVGFAQCSLRHDYVEGTSSSPVGYLEGIFVSSSWRRQGISRQLLQTCENWTRQQGCQEFASDCELSNADSTHFHLACGFEEAGRIICFAKKL